MSVPDPELKTHPVKAQYVCLVCTNRGEVESKVLAPGVIGWIPAFCATCPGNPEMQQT